MADEFFTRDVDPSSTKLVASIEEAPAYHRILINGHYLTGKEPYVFSICTNSKIKKS